MDFHSLSRKELQILCKKNKIPANITNVAMADALAVLPKVEGLDEFLNPKEEGDAGTPDIHQRSACRTSTQKKLIKEPESSKVSTRLRRGTRGGIAEGLVAEQENKDANVPETPAMLPSSRRRIPVPAVSTRRKKEVEMLEDDDKNVVQEKPTDVPKTPAAAPRSRARATGRTVCTKTETPGGGTSAHYNTRRSVRLLGKGLSKMSLMDTEEDTAIVKIVDVSEELSMSSVSQHVEDSSDTVNGASLEVSSLNYECQSHDSGLVSGTENVAGSGLLDEQQEEVAGKVNDIEDEPHDSKLQESFETCDGPKGSNESDADHQEKNNESEHLNMAGGNNIQDFEAMGDVDEKAADEKDVASSEEELEDKPENSEESRAEIENIEYSSDVTGASSATLGGENASSENAGADIEVCIESFQDNKKESMEIEIQFSLLDVGAHKAEDQKDASEKLEAAAQAEESEERAQGEGSEFDAANAFACVLQQVSVESTGISKDSCSSDGLMSVPSFNSKTLVDGDNDVIFEDTAMPKQVPYVSAEAMTVELIHEQASEIPVRSVVFETKDVANEVQTAPKIEDDMHNANMMKENLTTSDELQNMSMRVLKKMLKNKLDDGNKTDNNVVNKNVQEVERKRTALQALPQNLMTTGGNYV